MAGKIKEMIDRIIEKRSKGNPSIAKITRTKIVFKGIDPDEYTPETEDDPETIRKVQQIADKFGVTL